MGKEDCKMDENTTFAAELQRIFKGTRLLKDFRSIGDVAYGRLNERLTVKIQFVAREKRSEFDAVSVTVLNETKGVVDTCIIGLETVWGLQNLYGHMKSPFLWRDYNNRNFRLEWYDWKPQEQHMRTLFETIKQYLALWR